MNFFKVLPMLNPFTWGAIWWGFFLLLTVGIAFSSYSAVSEKIDVYIETDFPSVVSVLVSIFVGIICSYLIINFIGFTSVR